MLVTGAGRGIGKRLAIGFATRGAKVGLLARSKGELDLARGWGDMELDWTSLNKSQIKYATVVQYVALRLKRT